MQTKIKLFFTVLTLTGALVFSSCTVRMTPSTSNDVITPTPDSTTVTPFGTPTPIPSTSTYTDAQFKQYFYEIALGTEFYSQAERIRKWESPMTLEVKGTPTAADRATLDRVIAEIGQITDGRMPIRIVSDGGNSTIWFAPLAELSTYEPHYIKDNWGFFYASWDGNYHIYTTNIVIASDEPTQNERNHLIREELTQSLGLMQDSSQYPDSIFYIEWTDGQQYSDLDEAVIRQLYDPAVKAGMTQSDLEAIVK